MNDEDRTIGRMKYARFERERRFLLASLPRELEGRGDFIEVRDRYLTGTTLRLRAMRAADGSPIAFKFTQKIATDDPTCCRITNTYLTEAEFALFANVPGRVLRKRRFAIVENGVRFGVDRFLDTLGGLILAECEAASAEQLAAIQQRMFARCVEVTSDRMFTGGELSRAEPVVVLKRARDLLRG